MVRHELTLQALEAKRAYKAAKAAKDERSMAEARRRYQWLTHMIAKIDKVRKAKEKAPGDVAASTESTPNKTHSVYHDSGEDASV